MSDGAPLANPHVGRFQPGQLVQVRHFSRTFHIFSGDANEPHLSFTRWHTRRLVEGEKFLIKTSDTMETVILDASGQTWWTYTNYFETVAFSI